MSASPPETLPTHERSATTTSAARNRVLDELRRSPTPLDAAAVALRLGAHVTTARFHLDQLAAAGLVSRRPRAEKRRGRPRILYAPIGAARDDDSRTQLIGLLATALAATDVARTQSIEAGRRWADGFDAAASGDPATSRDPVPGLVDVLDRVGFDPELVGEQIRLRSCPFRDAAREHPDVVCSVHRGLIDRLLEGSSARARLLPFVEPALCLVALEREDVP